MFYVNLTIMEQKLKRTVQRLLTGKNVRLVEFQKKIKKFVFTLDFSAEEAWLHVLSEYSEDERDALARVLTQKVRLAEHAVQNSFNEKFSEHQRRNKEYSAWQLFQRMYRHCQKKLSTNL